MRDSLIEKYAGKAPTIDAPIAEPEVIESDLGCFGWLRGVKERALMLELRKTDGHILALGYAWLERVTFEPDHGITLHTPAKTVQIIGSGLTREARPGVTLLAGTHPPPRPVDHRIRPRPAAPTHQAPHHHRTHPVG